MRRALFPLLLASIVAARAGDPPTSLTEIPDEPTPYRVTPSPEDWRDESIYFVFTDRFSNGDPSNDRRGHANFDLADPRGCHGGDWKGIEKKLDYIAGLGATAIWVTPVLQNWRAYHGYATCNFLELEPRLGGLEDFRSLVEAAHKKGIRVIADIVCNHEADLIYYKDGTTEYRESGHEAGFYAKDKGERVLPIPVEFQDLSFFHNLGNIDRWDDLDAKPSHSQTGDFNGNDDFKTERPEVRAAMVKIYRRLIAETDVDGFRVDTVKHVERGFWETFCPAIRSYAAKIGKKKFFLYGEGWMGEDERVAPYTGTRGGKEFLFDGMLHFPLYYAIKDVFQDGKAPSRIAEELEKARLYEDDALNVTFFDNHDMPRFLHGHPEDLDRLECVLGFLYSVRGIPCLYYGTEQGFKGGKDPENREDMFERFDESHRLYKRVATLNRLRRELEPLRRGKLVLRYAEKEGPGLLAFSRVLGDDEVLVVLNTAADAKHGKIPVEGKLAGAKLEDRLGAEVVQAGANEVEVSLPRFGLGIYRRK
jgi:glycosidase